MKIAEIHALCPVASPNNCKIIDETDETNNQNDFIAEIRVRCKLVVLSRN